MSRSQTTREFVTALIERKGTEWRDVTVLHPGTGQELLDLEMAHTILPLHVVEHVKTELEARIDAALATRPGGKITLVQSPYQADRWSFHIKGQE